MRVSKLLFLINIIATTSPLFQQSHLLAASATGPSSSGGGAAGRILTSDAVLKELNQKYIEFDIQFYQLLLEQMSETDALYESSEEQVAEIIKDILYQESITDLEISAHFDNDLLLTGNELRVAFVLGSSVNFKDRFNRFKEKLKTQMENLQQQIHHGYASTQNLLKPFGTFSTQFFNPNELENEGLHFPELQFIRKKKKIKRSQTRLLLQSQQSFDDLSDNDLQLSEDDRSLQSAVEKTQRVIKTAALIRVSLVYGYTVYATERDQVDNLILLKPENYKVSTFASEQKLHDGLDDEKQYNAGLILSVDNLLQ